MSDSVGWHADTSDPRLQRYWDGFAWRGQRFWTGTQWVETPLGAPVPPSHLPAAPAPRRSDRAWWAGGAAALGIAVVVIVAVLVGRGGSSGTSGSGQTVDYIQFNLDDDATATYANLSLLSSYDPNQNDIGSYQIGASDCSQAGADLGRLRADTAVWPSVLRAPMARAEAAFASAIAACSAGNFASMKADMSTGAGYLTATHDAFVAHCTQSDQDVSKWRC